MLEVHYIFLEDRYGATVDLQMYLRTRMEKQPDAQSQLHVEAEVGRDVGMVKKFVIAHGKGCRTLEAKRTPRSHFAVPEWDGEGEGHTWSCVRLELIDGCRYAEGRLRSIWI